MGSVIKFNVVYEKPSWRESELSGLVVGLDDPVALIADNTPNQSHQGVLVGFAEGSHARRLSPLTAAQRRAVCLDTLAKFFGSQAAHPIEFHEKDWSAEQYSGGCYGGRFGTGGWTAYGPHLRQPVGVIHWAGTETAAMWNGYMDGAVRSGHRCADEIHTALSQQ